MMLQITKVNYISDYKLNVSFNNGESGVADLSCIIGNGVFKTLASLEQFSQAALNEELDTIVWPNGLDLAPEFVYFRIFKDSPQYQNQFKTWGYIT
jgi:hypothetical protein